LADCLPRLIAWVEAVPDILMPELAAKLEAAMGVVAHPASLSRALLKAGFSTKKTLLASESERADVRKDRQVWRTHRQPRDYQEFRARLGGFKSGVHRLCEPVTEQDGHLCLSSRPFTGGRCSLFLGPAQDKAVDSQGVTPDSDGGQAEFDRASVGVDERMGLAREPTARTSHAAIVSISLFPVATCW
jgi:hypothetical protein